MNTPRSTRRIPLVISAALLAGFLAPIAPAYADEIQPPVTSEPAPTQGPGDETPDPGTTPEPTETPTPEPVDPTPTPSPEPTPEPTPSPTPTPEPPTKPVLPGLAAGTQRWGGANRYETSVAVSKRYPAGVPVAFLASGTVFADSLSGAAAAAHLGGPLIVTEPGRLTPVVKTELARLMPKKIVVLGATGAVSSAVSNAAAKIAPVERWSGGDRYATSRTVVAKAFTSATSVYLATGRDFPDGLTAAAAAGTADAPVLLVDGAAGSLPADTLAQITGLGAKKAVLAGSTGAISAGIQRQLAAAGLTVTRYGGADRYSTAAAINAAHFKAGTKTTFVASGTAFPDALSAAAYAGAVKAPIFLVGQKYCMPAVEAAAARKIASPTRVLLGGAATVGAGAGAFADCLPQARGNTMTTNQMLAPGTALVSANGKHRLTVNSLGNVVVTNWGRTRWALGTKYPGSFLTLRASGALTLVDDATARWSTGAKKGAARVVLGNDGNLVITSSNGKSQYWSLSTSKAWRSNNRGPVFMAQTDRRWGGVRIGSSTIGVAGCVPAAMAMALRGYGLNATPLSVGQVMNKHGDFNRGAAGAGSVSIRNAAAQYGVMATPLTTQGAVQTALSQNRTVIALVRGPSNITYPGSTHAVVLHGYKSGQTTLLNPYGGIPARSWSVATLWSWQSYDPMDRNAGAVFWAIG